MRISLKIFDGYTWIYMDMYGCPGWISNPVQQVGYVPLEASIYPYISIHIHGYPTYPYISAWANFPDGNRTSDSSFRPKLCENDLTRYPSSIFVAASWTNDPQQTGSCHELQKMKDSEKYKICSNTINHQSSFFRPGQDLHDVHCSAFSRRRWPVYGLYVWEQSVHIHPVSRRRLVEL